MTFLAVPRFRFVPWILLIAGLSLFVFYGLAYAAVDPLGTAQTSVDSGVGLVETYGPVIGSMYLLYQLASKLVAKYARSSWFAKGKRLAIATGALGVVGAAVQAQVAGSPWNVIALAAIAAAFKLLTPTVPPASDPPVASVSALSGPTKVGTIVTLLLVVGMGGVAGGYGCGPKTTAVLNAALDCSLPARNDLVEALVPTAVTAIRKIANPSGKITVEALKMLFSGASLESEAGVIVACAEARAVEFIATVLPTPGVSISELAADTARIDGVALRGALAAQFPGVVFKIAQ